MIIINHPGTDPFFNIASEEFLLKHKATDVIFLYRNNPSVIVGKHQNTSAEINLDFLQENGIPVVRRISGGGTVYHDTGNINFCIIRNGEEGKLVNFEAMLRPIRDFLAEKGLNTTLGKHNELLCNGLKISGNAEHLFKKRVLHHGTLLYDTRLINLNESIASSEKKYRHNGVKSNRSVVGNLSDMLTDSLSTEEFADSLYRFLKHRFTARDYAFTDNDRGEIEKLIDSKYKRWEWNFGYSPDYFFTNHKFIAGYRVSFTVVVKKGLIQSATVDSEFDLLNDFNQFSYLFEGIRHSPETIRQVLEKEPFRKFWDSVPKEVFLQGFYQ